MFTAHFILENPLQTVAELLSGIYI